MVNYAETFTRGEALHMLSNIGIRNPARRYIGFYFSCFKSKEGEKFVLQCDLEDVRKAYDKAGIFRELAHYNDLKAGGYIPEAKEKLAEIEEMARNILANLQGREQ